MCPSITTSDAYMPPAKTNWAMLAATSVLSGLLGFFIGRMGK
jgi:hypothetical protein